jgi:hypothetical protein
MTSILLNLKKIIEFDAKKLFVIKKLKIKYLKTLIINFLNLFRIYFMYKSNYILRKFILSSIL